MALNSLNRNYGSSLTSREFWGGNNGLISVAIMPKDDKLVFPGMKAYNDADATTKEGALIRDNAERNMFRLVELLAQRGVIVTTSIPSKYNGTVAGAGAAANLSALLTGVKANDTARDKSTIIASSSKGKLDTSFSSSREAFHITFMVERADVFNKQDSKPGAVNPTAYAVDVLGSILTLVIGDSLFEDKTSQEKPDGSGGSYCEAEGAIAYVHDALPVVL